jgi:hypothetical protein
MAENPWVRKPPGEEPVPVIVELSTTTGPKPAGVAAPQPGVPVPDQADRLPQRKTPHGATVWWVGVTGGAGESTLASLARGSRAADHAWPIPENRGSLSRVVLVARTNFAGLAAAQRAAIEWASGVLGDGVRVEGLVLIPDMPGRMPKELRHLAQVVSGGLPHTWSLPWVDAWRFGPFDPSADLPKEFHGLLADLHLNSTAP